MPGYQMAIAPPIRTRIDMLTTGVRTPVGIKVFGEDLKEIERISVRSRACCARCRAPAAPSPSGRPAAIHRYRPNREAIARYGLTVRDVQDVVEAAVGGMPVSTAIAGRARSPSTSAMRPTSDRIRRRFVAFSCQCRRQAASPISAAPMRAPAQLRRPAAWSHRVRPARAVAWDPWEAADRSAWSGSAPTGLASPPMGGLSASPDLMEQWRQPGAAVPLGELADACVTTGPPMIKDENGVLVGYVFADIDQTQRDLGGWVDDAKTIVASQLALPAGARLQWTGQYEFLAEMEARLRYVIPLTLVLVVMLLHLSMRGWPQTFLVLSSLPFAVAGSVWLLAFMNYNLRRPCGSGSSPSRRRRDRHRHGRTSTRRSNGYARRPHSDTSGRGRGGG